MAQYTSEVQIIWFVPDEKKNPTSKGIGNNASEISFFFISRIMDTLTLRGTLEGNSRYDARNEWMGDIERDRWMDGWT